MDCSSYHTVPQRLLRASKYLLALRPIKFRQAPGTHRHCCLNTVFPSTNSSWLEPLSTQAGSVYNEGSWEFSSHILADLDLGLKLQLGKKASFIAFFFIFSDTVHNFCLFLDDFMATVCLVVRELESSQVLQEQWGARHHMLTSELCKLCLIADYKVISQHSSLGLKLGASQCVQWKGSEWGSSTNTQSRTTLGQNKPRGHVKAGTCSCRHDMVRIINSKLSPEQLWCNSGMLKFVSLKKTKTKTEQTELWGEHSQLY